MAVSQYHIVFFDNGKYLFYFRNQFILRVQNRESIAFEAGAGQFPHISPGVERGMGRHPDHFTPHFRRGLQRDDIQPADFIIEADTAEAF